MATDNWGGVNTTSALSKLDEAECAYERMKASSDKVRAAKTQRYRIISESGLYKLIMRSDKKEARVFQDWVETLINPEVPPKVPINTHSRRETL
jgi:prophage antirepressor-like protein